MGKSVSAVRLHNELEKDPRIVPIVEDHDAWTGKWRWSIRSYD